MAKARISCGPVMTTRLCLNSAARPSGAGAVVNLTGAQLNFLLDGYDIWRKRPHQHLHYASMY